MIIGAHNFLHIKHENVTLTVMIGLCNISISREFTIQYFSILQSNKTVSLYRNARILYT